MVGGTAPTETAAFSSLKRMMRRFGGAWLGRRQRRRACSVQQSNYSCLMFRQPNASLCRRSSQQAVIDRGLEVQIAAHRSHAWSWLLCGLNAIERRLSVVPEPEQAVVTLLAAGTAGPSPDLSRWRAGSGPAPDPNGGVRPPHQRGQGVARKIASLVAAFAMGPSITK